MGYIGAIIAGVGQLVNIIGRASTSPNYPSPPKLHKLPVQEAKKHLEDYEAQRMGASIDAWKQRFPELYQGGQFMVDDIRKQQQGQLGGHAAADMKASGLGPVREGDQYALSRDIGLNPLTLSQRTSQAVTRQIAQNPEWTNKITGGTLATMLANNYQNAQAYGMMTAANRTAQYVAGKQAGMYNTQALLGGMTGAARITGSIYDRFNPLSPEGQGAYVPAAAGNAPYQPSAPSGYGSYSGAATDPWNNAPPPASPMYQGGWGSYQSSPQQQSSMYSNAWDPNQFSLSPYTDANLFAPTGTY